MARRSRGKPWWRSSAGLAQAGWRHVLVFAVENLFHQLQQLANGIVTAGRVDRLAVAAFLAAIVSAQVCGILGIVGLAQVDFVGKRSNGCDVPPVNFGATGADYLTRGINPVLGLTANTTTEAIYGLGADGADGAPLNGSKA